MKKTTFKPLILGMLSISAASAYAIDAQSIAMGGTGVTTGTGINGVMHNPALLGKQKESGDRFSFRLGAAFDVQDNFELNKKLDDTRDIIDRLNQNATDLEAVTINQACGVPGAAGSTVCATGMGSFRSNATEAINLLEDLDQKPLTTGFNVNLGSTFLKTKIPFAVNLSVNAAVLVEADITDNDTDYATSFLTAAHGANDLTLDDINNNPNLTLDITTSSISVDNADDKLTSTAAGAAIVKGELAVSFATTQQISDKTIHLGMTPKYLRLFTSNIVQNVNDNASELGIKDQYERNKTEENAFSMDLGVLYESNFKKGLSYGAVVKNFVPYAAETATGFVFETTPQVIASVGYDSKRYTLASDIAINKAKKDNIETQAVGVGGAVKFSYFGLRGGISHDFVKNSVGTTYSAGVDVGFLELGLRYNLKSSAQVALQCAFTF